MLTLTLFLFSLEYFAIFFYIALVVNAGELYIKIN